MLQLIWAFHSRLRDESESVSQLSASHGFVFWYELLTFVVGGQSSVWITAIGVEVPFLGVKEVGGEVVPMQEQLEVVERV